MQFAKFKYAKIANKTLNRNSLNIHTRENFMIYGTFLVGTDKWGVIVHWLIQRAVCPQSRLFAPWRRC